MKTPLKLLPALLLLLTLAACAPEQRLYHSYAVADYEQPPRPATEVYYYPLHGQSFDRQDRDRYECYLWAKQQTGFDPSARQLTPRQHTVVVPDPATGADTAAGLFTGAVLGAIVGGPHNTGEGALIGALAGGAIGAISDAARQEHAARIEAQYARRSHNWQGELDRRATNYRRAMKACLDGRGYSVR